MTFRSSRMSTPSTSSPPAVTSVTYTIPASASPRETLVTTALTLSSCDTGLTLTPALSRTCLAYLPAGTSSAARTTLRSGLARSSRPLTPLGLPFSTTMASRLLAKLWGVPTRAWLPAKLKVTLVPPLALLYRSPSLVKAAVSEAAAKTLISFDEPDAEPPPESSSPPPQAASTSAATVSTAARRNRDRSMRPPLARRRFATGRRRQLDHHVGRLDGGDGEHARGELELVGSLPGHQRHHPVGAGLELDLGHDLVLDDPSDDPLEPVAGRLGDHLVTVGQMPVAAHELGQCGPVDHPLPALGPPGAQPTGVGPAADGVGADPEQLGDLAHTIGW